MTKKLLSVLLLLVGAIQGICAQEPYAVLNNYTLTFYYDDQKATRGGMDVGPFEDDPAWYAHHRTITTVVFDSSFAGCNTITSTENWFRDCSKVYSITGLENLNTSNVTNMSGMFAGCSSLLTSLALDVSNLNTANVTDMHEMFKNCRNLTSLDLSNFNTAKVTDMSLMFQICRKLASLDLSNFNTANVTNMRDMFADCRNLTSLDVSNFNTANVTDMSYMFADCSSLTSLDLSNFNTANVTDMSTMFADCSSLTSLDLSNFNTANVWDMGYMFRNCSSLTSLDVSHFNTAKVTSMGYMFRNCSSLTSLDLSNFNTAKVRGMYSMFSGCSKLTSLDLSNFNTANVTDMSNLFDACSGLTIIYCNDTWTCDNSGSMFKNCYSLRGAIAYNEYMTNATYANPDTGYFTRPGETPTAQDPSYAVLSNDNTTLTFYCDNQMESRGGRSVGPFDGEGPIIGDLGLPNLPSWYDMRKQIKSVVFDDSFANCTSITSTAFWFIGCEKIKTITGLENLKTDNVTDMRYMFEACSGLTSLDVNHFNTANVTNMAIMFGGCSSLTSLDVSNFNTANVTDMRGMFADCSKLTSLDVSNFNTANVTDMFGMFYECSDLTTIYCNDTWSSGSSEEMFYGCTSLKGAIAYDETKIDVTYANPNTGYFTRTSGTSISTLNAANGLLKGGIYTLNGKRLCQPQKGINIIGGRKVMVK